MLPRPLNQGRVFGNKTNKGEGVQRRRMFRKLGVLLVLGLGALVAVYWWFRGEKTPPLKILKTIRLGGNGKWDYVCLDAEARRLYVPRSDTVQVVDLDNGVLAGTIANAGRDRVHGVALAPEQNLGLITAGKDRCVNVFDLRTLKITATVKTRGIPDCIVYDPASKHVFANHHKDGDITVIDPAALHQTVTISVGGRLESVVADGAGQLFVCVQDKNEVVQIDSMTNKVLAHWPLETGKAPTGLAIDTQRMRLYAGCGNQKMVILDAKTGTILGTTPIGKNVDGVAFEPSLRLAVSANGDGTASVVKETWSGKFETIQTVRTTPGAKTITVDPKTHQFLLPCNVPDREKNDVTFGIIVIGAEAAN
jgi:DNA-binding beta-propeller fold protein YncE